MTYQKMMHVKGVKPPYIEWVCKKCGLMRNNKSTHVHGVPMIISKEKYEKDKKAKEQGEQAQRG